MTATVLNLKIAEIENKIPDVSSFVTTTVLDKKIGEVRKNILLLLIMINLLVK